MGAKIWIPILAVLSLLGVVFIAGLIFSMGPQSDSLLICDKSQPIGQCQIARGNFSYEPMDGLFVIRDLNIPEGNFHFESTECWVRPQGSTCEDSTTGENKTGFNRTIIPLARQSWWQ